MLDPASTLMQGKFKDFKILSDTRTAKDTLDVFGGEYPGGALYTRADWIAKNEATTQKLTNAIEKAADENLHQGPIVTTDLFYDERELEVVEADDRSTRVFALRGFVPRGFALTARRACAPGSRGNPRGAVASAPVDSTPGRA